MTDITHDPDAPYVVIGVSTKRAYARFRFLDEAHKFVGPLGGCLTIVQTKPAEEATVNEGYTEEPDDPKEPEGVWAVIDRDHWETITTVFATEIEALRYINGREYGRVAFLRYGWTLGESS